MRREWMVRGAIAFGLSIAGCAASGGSPEEGSAGDGTVAGMNAAGSGAPSALPVGPGAVPVNSAMTGGAEQPPNAAPAPCADCAPSGTGDVSGKAGVATTEPPSPSVNDRDSECEVAAAFEPLIARDGETCWEFQTHGVASPTDTTKFQIQDGESYSQFYFDVPWPAGSLATRFGADFDNLKVLHHYLVFSSRTANAHGTISRNVLGTTLGENAELLAGWAAGGCTTTYPQDVGVKLPETGKIMVQWHHYNSTGSAQSDGSKVQICTVPAGSRPNVAGITFLGTENFNGLLGMGPGKQQFGGTCTNDSGAPINIIGFMPHMHTIGKHMLSVVNKAGGGTETVFDKPFVWDQQVNYMRDTPYVLQPGDSITSTCTYQNDTGMNVAFGQSTHQEMCYQFALSYPYNALNNGVISLIGATNTCW